MYIYIFTLTILTKFRPNVAAICPAKLCRESLTLAEAFYLGNKQDKKATD